MKKTNCEKCGNPTQYRPDSEAPFPCARPGCGLPAEQERFTRTAAADLRPAARYGDEVGPNMPPTTRREWLRVESRADDGTMFWQWVTNVPSGERWSGPVR